MKWKEFFKPNFKRIIIFAIIFIFSVLTIKEPPKGCCSCCPIWAGLCIASCCSCYNAVAWPYFLIAQTMDFFGIIISIIYWYLLSCFIVWIYDNYKIGRKK